MSITRHAITLALVIAATAGCSAVPAKDPEQPAVAEAVVSQRQTESSEDVESRQKSELIYQYLLGDTAARRGDDLRAADAMVEAAQISADPEVAFRAYGLSMRAGRFESALQMSRLLGSRMPDSDRPRILELQALARLSRHNEFVVRLKAFNEAAGSDIGRNLRQASEILGRQPDPAAWMPVMRRLAQRYSSEPEAYLAEAWLAYKAGQSDTADRALDEALLLRPGWEQVALMRLSQLKKTDQRAVLSDYAEGFLNDYPDRGEFRIAWARLLAEWGDYEKALTQFSELVKREPEHGEAIYTAGVLSMELGHGEDATRMLKRYLELNPGHDQSRLFLARIAAAAERYEDALSWLSAVRSDGHFFDAQLRTAFVLAGAKRTEEALEHLVQMVPDSVPDQVRIYLAHEQILRGSRGLEAALELLNVALIDIPDNTDLLYARGLVTAQLKLIQKHEADMRLLIALEPDNAHAYNALGYTLADQTNRLDEALALIEQALALLPEDPFILDSMGWVHYRLGNSELARQYLQKAIDLRMDAEIAAHLGEVLWMGGEHDQARTVWQLGRENDPDNSVLRETLRKFSP